MEGFRVSYLMLESTEKLQAVTRLWKYVTEGKVEGTRFAWLKMTTTMTQGEMTGALKYLKNLLWGSSEELEEPMGRGTAWETFAHRHEEYFLTERCIQMRIIFVR